MEINERNEKKQALARIHYTESLIEKIDKMLLFCSLDILLFYLIKIEFKMTGKDSSCLVSNKALFLPDYQCQIWRFFNENALKIIGRSKIWSFVVGNKYRYRPFLFCVQRI